MSEIVLVLAQMLSLSGSCHAGNFGYVGDPHSGGDAACLRRPVGPSDVGVAHRSMRCGARVLLVNPRTMKTVTASVVDHGPYGALLGKRWVIKRRKTDPGTWRGCLDLTPAAARRLGHNGMEEVLYIPLSM